MSEKLFVIIPVLNRWEQTRNCLNRLLCSSYTDIAKFHRERMQRAFDAFEAAQQPASLEVSAS